MNKYKDSVKRYYYCFILGPLFMILEACGEFILPFINANIINKGAQTGDVEYILVNGGYMVLLSIFMLITGILGANFAVRGAAHTAADVRNKTFKQIQKFSFENIDEFSTGSLITRITNDITQVQSFIQTLLRGVFRSPIMLIGAIVMSFILNPSLALIICIVVPLLAVGIATIIRIASPRYTKMQTKIDALNNNIDETITNERVIKSFVREEYEKEKFGIVNNELQGSSIKALKMMILMQPLSTIAINISTLLIVLVAGKQIMIGDMEIGTLTAFITYLTQILNALDFLANIFLQGTRAAASDRRITEVLEAKLNISDDFASHKDKMVENGDIAMKNVAFKYYKNREEYVLEGVNFDIKAGEFVGIVGSTGSGKTTLVSLIPRLYDADQGEVLVDGINVREWSLAGLREAVAFVLQKNTLFSGTIAENLSWGKEDATREEMMEACEIAQAAEFINRFKDGLDTEIEQGGANLSGGQRQRLCIARALLKSPRILVLDDSTSAVDTATDAKIREAFRKKMPGITKIVIAQRISSIIDADKIIVMDEGRVAGIGTHAELIKNCLPYQEIYYSQKDSEESGSSPAVEGALAGQGGRV